MNETAPPPRPSQTAVHVWNGTGALHLGYRDRTGLVYEPESGRFTLYSLEPGRAEIGHSLAFGPDPEEMEETVAGYGHLFEASGSEWLMPVLTALARGERGAGVDPEQVYQRRYGEPPQGSSPHRNARQAEAVREAGHRLRGLIPAAGAPRTFFIVGLVVFAAALAAGHGLPSAALGAGIVYGYYLLIMKK